MTVAIALSHSHVLDNLPRAVLRAGRHNAPMFGFEAAHDLVKALVSLAAFEKSDKMIAEGFIFIHGYSVDGRKSRFASLIILSAGSVTGEGAVYVNCEGYEVACAFSDSRRRQLCA